MIFPVQSMSYYEARITSTATRQANMKVIMLHRKIVMNGASLLFLGSKLPMSRSTGPVSLSEELRYYVGFLK
jgi:hypothetical protein